MPVAGDAAIESTRIETTDIVVAALALREAEA